MELSSTETVFNLINTGALVFFVYMFTTGQVVSVKILEKILKEAENRTTKVVTELTETIGKSVENAVSRGIHKGNGRSKE